MARQLDLFLAQKLFFNQTVPMVYRPPQPTRQIPKNTPTNDLSFPFKSEFAVELSPEEQKKIQKELDQINISLIKKISHKNTAEESFSKTDFCNDPIDPTLSRRIQSLLQELSFPQKWVQSKESKQTFAQSIYSPTKPDWTRFESLRYLADESVLSYFTVRRVLSELRKRVPSFRPRRVLDFGAGPGVAARAAYEVFEESIQSINAVENNLNMTNIGKIITKDFPVNINWTKDLNKEHLSSQDLCIAAFALSEYTDEREICAVAEKLWRKTKGCLVLVESGMPHGSEVVRIARDFLLKRFPPSRLGAFNEGASVVAPCSHDGPCPIALYERRKKIWCKFAQKIPIRNLPKNSSLYVSPKHVLTEYQKIKNTPKYLEAQTRKGAKGAKPAAAPSDAEKPPPEKSHRFESRQVFEHVFRFSYAVLRKGDSTRRKLEDLRALSILRGPSKTRHVAGGKEPPELIASRWGRIIDAPRKGKGHVSLKLCYDGNVESRVITKSFGPQEFGHAKKSKWGDLWPYPERKVVTEKTAHRLKFKKMKDLRRMLERKKDAEEEILGEASAVQKIGK